MFHLSNANSRQIGEQLNYQKATDAVKLEGFFGGNPALLVMMSSRIVQLFTWGHIHSYDLFTHTHTNRQPFTR